MICLLVLYVGNGRLILFPIELYPYKHVFVEVRDAQSLLYLADGLVML